MEQVNNSAALAMLQAVAAQTQVAQTGKSDGGSDFQKLMEKAQQSQPEASQSDSKVEQEPAKTNKPATAKKENPNQKKQQEDESVEAAKQLQVYLTPLTPEELSQYPASWLPDVKEGEPIVCIGVTTDANGQQMPILMGAEAAQQRFGREVVAPEIMEKYQSLIEVPEETMLEAPGEPEQMVEAPLMEEAPVVKEELPEVEIKPVVEEASQSQGQEKDDGAKVETTGAEQAPQRLFHDVKAAPVKVGEVYDAKQAEEPDVAQQIDTGLAQALEKGESMVRIQLNPENLGSVTVEITRSAEGILHVALNAHSGETRGLLERHAGELQGMLASRTEQNVEVEVQRQQESQQGQNQQQNYDGRNGHAQDGQERRRQRHDQTSSQDFMQQLRLGLIPLDGE